VVFKQVTLIRWHTCPAAAAVCPCLDANQNRKPILKVYSFRRYIFALRGGGSRHSFLGAPPAAAAARPRVPWNSFVLLLLGTRFCCLPPTAKIDFLEPPARRASPRFFDRTQAPLQSLSSYPSESRAAVSPTPVRFARLLPVESRQRGPRVREGRIGGLGLGLAIATSPRRPCLQRTARSRRQSPAAENAAVTNQPPGFSQGTARRVKSRPSLPPLFAHVA